MMPAQIEIPDPRVTPTLAIEDVAQILGMSRASTYAAVQRGEIPVLKFGRRLVVPTAKFLDMLGLGAQ